MASIKDSIKDSIRIRQRDLEKLPGCTSGGSCGHGGRAADRLSLGRRLFSDLVVSRARENLYPSLLFSTFLYPILLFSTLLSSAPSHTSLLMKPKDDL